ncbi:hypothetical protein HDV00_006374 [Rhizophlyctis rosea]|nr:hypothetical protein HDV00_006374 [Rhizophlyctis rosea]
MEHIIQSQSSVVGATEIIDVETHLHADAPAVRGVKREEHVDFKPTAIFSDAVVANDDSYCLVELPKGADTVNTTSASLTACLVSLDDGRVTADSRRESVRPELEADLRPVPVKQEVLNQYQQTVEIAEVRDLIALTKQLIHQQLFRTIQDQARIDHLAADVLRKGNKIELLREQIQFDKRRWEDDEKEWRAELVSQEAALTAAKDLEVAAVVSTKDAAIAAVTTAKDAEITALVEALRVADSNVITYRTKLQNGIQLLVQLANTSFTFTRAFLRQEKGATTRAGYTFVLGPRQIAMDAGK